jgi:hypothetical protein
MAHIRRYDGHVVAIGRDEYLNSCPQSYTLKVKRPKGWGGFLIKTSGGQLRG